MVSLPLIKGDTKFRSYNIRSAKTMYIPHSSIEPSSQTVDSVLTPLGVEGKGGISTKGLLNTRKGTGGGAGILIMAMPHRSGPPHWGSTGVPTLGTAARPGISVNNPLTRRQTQFSQLDKRNSYQNINLALQAP